MANSVPPTSLTAEAVFGAVNLSAGTNASVNPCLPYLQVGGYQFWAATTNDRTAATLLTTSPLSFWQHTTPTTAQQYWYWVKTVDASGAVSDFYPSTTTSTVTATPKTAASLSLTASAPAIVVQADTAGVVSSFAGAAATMKVLDGATDVTASWAFSAAATGVTVSQSTATFSVTAMAADNGYFDVTATRTGYPNLTVRVTVAKAKAGVTGAAGSSAQALQLTASSQIFQVSAAGANSPASITFTATLLGGLTGTPVFTVPAGTATLTGTGNTRTLTFANLGSDTATITATVGAFSDTITVAKLREGAAGTDAVVALLSNEAHTLQADASGTVSSFTGAATAITIFQGITNTTASWTLSKADSGVTSSLSGTTVTITAMASDSGYVDITATRSGYTTLVKRFTLTKSKAGPQGVAGSSAQALLLTTTSQVFQITAAGANSPASITLTANLLGGLAGTPTFTVDAGTATLTGTGASRTLTYANLGSDTATITATVGAFSDTVTVAKLREGATGASGAAGAAGTDAVVALLSNEAHTLQANAAGTVASFTGAASTITVFQGITNTTASWTISKADSGVTSTLSGTTVTVTAMSADNGYVDVSAARSGYTTITKRFTLTKSREGAVGAAGTDAARLALTATSQIFSVTTAGVATPTSVTFTSTNSGGLTGTPTFTVTSGTATLTGTGSTRTLTYANLATETATIQSTVGAYSDYITVAKIRQGATGSTGAQGDAGYDAIIGLLSNEAHTIQAASDGTVSSFAGAVSTLTIYEGQNNTSASWAVTKVDSGVTSTLSTKTITITAMSADNGYVDITATRSGYANIVKRFSLTKSKAGAAGGQGSRGSKHFYVSGHSVWSDTAANTASNVEGGKQLNDIVTLYDSTSFSATKFWNGTSWVTITQAIDGNLLVTGTVGATQISASYVYAGTLTASQITAGTFTGLTFQTASGTGTRVVIAASTNEVTAYNSSNAVVARMGGTGTDGAIYASAPSTTTRPAIYGNTSSTTHAAIIGYTSSTAAGVHARTILGNGTALVGQGNNNTANSHGVYGISTGTSNGGAGYVGMNGSSGGHAFYAETGSYAPFTGAHDGLILKDAAVEVGDILVDVRVISKPSISDALTEVARSSAPNQATCVGVFVNRRAMAEDDYPPVALLDAAPGVNESGTARARRRDKKQDALIPQFDALVMNSLGEGQVNVVGEGGDIAAGDLIVTSSTPGKGMRQILNGLPDDVVRNYTVAKARESAIFTNANQVRQIACIYLCG